MLMPAWEPCECCDEYVCNIHDLHVMDCPCPEIEWWAEHDLFPYEDCVNEAGELIDNLGNVVEIC